MPIAYPFSTLGAFNGLAGCVPKVDVTLFDHWTTFSGYNKDSLEAVTPWQIEQSTQRAARLFWNLYRLDLSKFYNGVEVDELIIEGDTNAAIQPEKRTCGGSLSFEQSFNLIAFTESKADLTLTDGLVRMYEGELIEENFIGYGGAEVFDLDAPISSYILEQDAAGIGEAWVGLGGYGYASSQTSRTWQYTYVKVKGISFVFGGAVANGTGSFEFVQSPPATKLVFDGAAWLQAEIDFEMWEYD